MPGRFRASKLLERKNGVNTRSTSAASMPIPVSAHVILTVVTGEVAGLQRMVSNLLSNAIKYTPPDADRVAQLAGEGHDHVAAVVGDGAQLPVEGALPFHQPGVEDHARHVAGHRRGGVDLGVDPPRTAVPRPRPKVPR